MRRVSPRFRVGTVVRVNESVPHDKRRLARVVERSEVRTNGRGTDQRLGFSRTFDDRAPAGAPASRLTDDRAAKAEAPAPRLT